MNRCEKQFSRTWSSFMKSKYSGGEKNKVVIESFTNNLPQESGTGV